MKKLFVCAAAAIVALASCSKTELINTEAPKEIGFKAVTGSMTKALGEQRTSLSDNLGVFAFVNKVNGNSHTDESYFGNTEFKKSGENFTGGKFWPLQSSLDFIVYAPYDGTAGNVTLDETTKELTIKVDNSNVTSINNQKDYLYGAAYYDNNGSGFVKNTISNGVTTETIVPTALKHALAKITVSLTVKNVTVNSVELVSPTMSGSYTVDYNDVTPTPEWTPATPTSPATQFNNFSFEDLKGLTSSSDTGVNGEEAIMVVPNTDITSLVINYLINGTNTSLDAVVDLGTGRWTHGTHYTYNIRINPQGIKFAVPTINGWETGSGLNETIN